MGKRFQSTEPEPAPVQSFGTDYDQELIAAMEANAPEPASRPEAEENLIAMEDAPEPPPTEYGLQWGPLGLTYEEQEAAPEDTDLGLEFGPLGVGIEAGEDFKTAETLAADAGVPGPAGPYEGTLKQENTNKDLEDEAAREERARLQREQFFATPYADKAKKQLELLDTTLTQIGIDDEIDPITDADKLNRIRIATHRRDNLRKLDAATLEYEAPYQSYWARASTGTKIASAIALALGTIGGGLTRTGRNVAAEMIIKFAGQDARQQRADRTQKHKASMDRFTRVRAILGDDEAAINFRTSENLKKANFRLQAAIGKARTQGQRASIMNTMATIELKQKQLRTAALKAMKKNKTTGDVTYNKVGGMYQKEPRYRSRSQGGESYHPTDPNGKPLSTESLKRFTQAEAGWRATRKINEMIKSGSWGIKKGIGAYKLQAAAAVEMFGRMQSGGAITSDEIDTFNSFTPGWASSMWSKAVGERWKNELLGGGKAADDRIKFLLDYFQANGTGLTSAPFTTVDAPLGKGSNKTFREER